MRAVIEMFKSFTSNYNLIRRLVDRDVKSRYKGSMLGLLWPVITPILMLFVYTFVFSIVFNAKWGVEGDSKADFALILFIGLLVFNMFSECISRSTTLILSNSNYVKKVVFPLEILPWTVLGVGLFNFLLGMFVWILGYILIHGMPNWTTLLIPIVLIPFALITIGLSWILAALSVYLRDLGLIVAIGLQVLMFLSPIFYPMSLIPERYRDLMYFNPMTIHIEMMRDMMFWGHVPEFKYIVLTTITSCIVATMGYSFFMKSKRGFADVI